MENFHTVEDCQYVLKPGMRFDKLSQLIPVCRALVEASGRGQYEIRTVTLLTKLFVSIGGDVREYYMRDVPIPDALRASARAV